MLGSFGRKLLKFYASIIQEGDATNIRELWDGYGLQNRNRPLTAEEVLYPDGMKHHMIWVPKTLRDQGHSPDYNKLPSIRHKIACEQRTLRQLAFELEKEGIDYPPELPDLGNIDLFSNKSFIEMKKIGTN